MNIFKRNPKENKQGIASDITTEKKLKKNVKKEKIKPPPDAVITDPKPKEK